MSDVLLLTSGGTDNLLLVNAVDSLLLSSAPDAGHTEAPTLRTLSVPAESRAFLVPVESRTYTAEDTTP